MSIKDIPIQPKRGRGRPPKAIKETTTDPTVDQLNIAATLLRSSGALFDTLDMNIYKARLDSFSLNDLHNEALRVGLKIGTDRVNCTRAILDVFTEYRNKFVPSYIGVGKIDDIPLDKRARALELMKDGK